MIIAMEDEGPHNSRVIDVIEKDLSGWKAEIDQTTEAISSELRDLKKYLDEFKQLGCKK